jgi:hypothetical protein
MANVICNVVGVAILPLKCRTGSTVLLVRTACEYLSPSCTWTHVCKEEEKEEEEEAEEEEEVSCSTRSSFLPRLLRVLVGFPAFCELLKCYIYPVSLH